MATADRTVQTLVLSDFPHPLTARALSPNGGRLHWAKERRHKLGVQVRVKLAVREQGLQPMAAPVRVTLRYVHSVHRKRDTDNATTGVTKAVLDALVRSGVLQGDDTARLELAPVQIAVEPGRTALEITLEALP